MFRSVSVNTEVTPSAASTLLVGETPNSLNECVLVTNLIVKHLKKAKNINISSLFTSISFSPTKKVRGAVLASRFSAQVITQVGKASWRIALTTQHLFPILRHIDLILVVSFRIPKIFRCPNIHWGDWIRQSPHYPTSLLAVFFGEQIPLQKLGRFLWIFKDISCAKDVSGFPGNLRRHEAPGGSVITA